MRRANITTFDEFVPVGASSTSPVFTDQELNAKLGHFDQMAIQVVIDNVTGTGSFDLYVEHSSDGRNFIVSQGGVANPPITAGLGDVTLGALSTSQANVAWGFPRLSTALPQNAQTNLLSFVRFRMMFSNGTTSGHIRVHVTQRDQG
jgi:hypothetical protein